MAQATPHPTAVIAARRADGTRSAIRLAFGAAAMAMATSVQAQGSPCEQLRQTLAAKLHGDVRTYTLEAVPSNTPLPPGAKFIGTCEGGAKKIMYRKGNPPPLLAASAAAPAAKPVPVPAPASAAKAAPSPAPVAPPALVAKTAPVVLTPSVVAASASVSARAASAATATAAPVKAAAVPEATTTAAAASSSADGDVTFPAVPASDADASSEMLFPARSTEAEGPSLTEQATIFAGAHWPWAAGIVLSGLLLALGAWVMHRRHYDASGLPRGPRL